MSSNVELTSKIKDEIIIINESKVSDDKSNDIVIDINDEYSNLEKESALLYIKINNKSKCKQLFIVIPVISVILFIIYYKNLMNAYFISAVSFIGSWIIFWNFPQIGVMIQHKPIYVDDLVLRNSSLDIRYKFIRYYSYLTNFLLAILVMVIADYTFIKLVDDGFDTIYEVIGTIGGLISLYFKFQSLIGKLVLTICYKLKNSNMLQLYKK